MNSEPFISEVCRLSAAALQFVVPAFLVQSPRRFCLKSTLSVSRSSVHVALAADGSALRRPSTREHERAAGPGGEIERQQRIFKTKTQSQGLL